ncbi:tetratricopeptide repeat protein [Planctomycetes bacterium K23_9]|uniref:Doubled CXXCH motif (Paired_CXXCH_1) n=1 Tax=Stieleria marina TaxID=1930275 RepID=A0A517P0P2_9BACT|nr:hypothetical protein K239x_49610 [Planctomycetes bacterium K23_9]
MTDRFLSPRRKRLIALDRHMKRVAVVLLAMILGCQKLAQDAPEDTAQQRTSTSDVTNDSSKAAPVQTDARESVSMKQVKSDAPTKPQWIGSESCRECHTDRHESYQQSHHSRSLTAVDASTEKLDDKILHERSHRKYEVTKRGDTVWHIEKLLERSGDSTEPLTLSEFPIRYVMGSGKFAKGYLVADDDYLLQSPLTWYAKSQQYGMSPGYDTPMHGSFSRAITDQCLFCHAGHVERRDNNPHHFTIHELAIGCERCHGAGGDHVKHYESLAGKELPSQTPPANASMINPTKLSREAVQSLCAQCHRQGVAPVSAPGKQDWDFQPGQDFAAVKFNYDLIKTDPPTNEFVGHFAQLGESKCYQQSQMTCITCHSPHQHTSGDALHNLHRQQCNSCHQSEDQSCSLELQTRIDQAQNRCVSCHMPKRDSSVPHTSTTDHRIAVHNSVAHRPPNGAPEAEPTLLKKPVVYPLQDVPESMTQQQADRMRALGLFGLFRMNVGNPNMESLFNDANRALTQIASSGQGDEAVFAAMASLTQIQSQMSVANRTEAAQKHEYAMRCAQEAIRLNELAPGGSHPTESLGDAMEVAGKYFSSIGQHQLAARVFQDLTAIRRRKYDWATLGLSLGKIGDNVGAAKALRQAIHIHAGDPDVYEILAIVLKSTDPTEAERLNRIAARLREAAKP